MRIKSKKEIVLETPIPVYDIEVPETSNFTLSSGVIVHNSKDISDGLAGALYNASLHEADFSFHLVEDADTIMDTNNPADNKDEKQGLLDSLVPMTLEKAMADMTIIDTIPDVPKVEDNKPKPVDRIKEIQSKAPGMTLSDAMKEYLKEMSSSTSKDRSEVDNITTVDPVAEAKRKFLEAKARQQGGNINTNDNRLQQMQDDKDGIIMF